MNRYTWSILLLIVICYVHLSSAKANHKQSKTHELLSKIGFSKIRTPSNHHRKRLAVESRQHSRSDDSHMFVIKLPPNQHYYVHNKPNAVSEDHSKNLPVGFKNNGRPAKIYHWNLPVLKKLAVKHKSRVNNKIFSFKSPNSWNDVLDKPNLDQKTTFKKQSFYIPTKPKKSSFFKYFPGNGKPKSFYVIEKSKKKPHFHRLLP